MAQRDEIIAYLDELLDIGAFTDYGPNGLQVPGADEVSLVVTGVSAQRELFERAAAEGAQLVLCHHGLFWDFHPRAITPADEGAPARRCSTPTSRWPATTCRSTPTPRSATTR